MRDAVKKDLGRSARLFKNVVYPEIGHWFGDGHVRMVEAETTSELGELLDQLSGIDAWHVETDAGMQSLASRVQSDFGYETFTIRKERDSGARTEFEKRKQAIVEGYEYPHWTVQAYVDYDTEEVINAAACHTIDLYRYLMWEDEGDGWYVQSGPNASFIVVGWEDLEASSLRYNPMHILSQQEDENPSIDEQATLDEVIAQGADP